MNASIDAGADDVAAPEGEDGVWTVTTGPTSFQAVKDGLEKTRIPIEEAGIAMIPTTRVEVRGENARKLLALIEAVEDLDDVQKVYSNADIPNEELAALGL
jgi:transcriptional/translational regulatory protein YebC/TACO1